MTVFQKVLKVLKELEQECGNNEGDFGDHCGCDYYVRQKIADISLIIGLPDEIDTAVNELLDDSFAERGVKYASAVPNETRERIIERCLSCLCYSGIKDAEDIMAMIGRCPTDAEMAHVEEWKEEGRRYRVERKVIKARSRKV